MRLNFSDYRPVADLTRDAKIMDRAARLQDFWRGVIEEPSFIDNTFTGYGHYRNRTFRGIADQVFGLARAIRSRVCLPPLNAYQVEKGPQTVKARALHFDRLPAPLYLVHFGEVANTVVHVGTVLEEEGQVTHMDSTPIELPSGHVLRLEASDYHCRGETHPAQMDEVRQVLFFKRPSLKERIEEALGL